MPRNANGPPQRAAHRHITAAPIAKGQAAPVRVANLRRQRNCPLIKAACRLGDPAVLAVVLRVHPAALCAAARRERAA